MNVVSFFVTNIPFWWGTLITEEPNVSVGTADLRGNLYLPLIFCCEHKTPPKNKIYLKMKKIGPPTLGIQYFPRTEENI